MSAIAFFRQLRDVGVDEDTACRMTEQFEQEISAVRREMLATLSTNILGLDAAETGRSAGAVRAARYRERRKQRDAGVTESVTNVTESVTERDGVTEIPSPEKVSPTPPLKLTPTLPSGDKSPSGDYPREDAHEALAGLPVVEADEVIDLPQLALAPSLAEPAPQLPALVVHGELLPVAAAPAKRRARGDAVPLDEAAFERFWAEYPRKDAKKPAKVEFAKACAGIRGPEPPIEVILRGLEAAKRDWRMKGTEPQYIPHARTWLHQGRWDDEHGTDGPGNRGTTRYERSVENMALGAMEALNRRRGERGGCG